MNWIWPLIWLCLGAALLVVAQVAAIGIALVLMWRRYESRRP